MRHFYTILFLFFVLTFKSHTQQFWGTTSQGGPTGAGTIYSWKKGETPKVRYSFPVETDGRNINPSLVELGDGYLYGTTVYGGRWDHGVLFKVRKEGGDYQVLKHFEGIGDTNPAHGLFLSDDGKLVGMLIEPSSVRFANTSLFSINPDGSDYKIIKNLGYVFTQYNVVSKQRDGFIYSVDGINSAIHKLNLMDNTFQRTTLSNSLGFVGGGLIYASDGYIYTLGRTPTNNSQSHVGVIRVSPDGREVKLLDTLATYNSTMEAAPVCDNFIEKDGFVYGHIVYKQTAQTFRVKLKDATDVEILHTYNSYAQGSLFVLNNDKIYLYKAAEAGTNGATVIYHFDISTKQLKTVFNGGAYAFLEPSFTTRMLITADRSAAIFIQQIRSHYRSGALWEWRPNNFELKHIVSVGNYPMGAYPSNKLVKDDKGNLYGYATYGGRYGNGTIYKIDIEGNFKVIKHLDHGRDLYVKWISDMVYLNNNLYILSAQNQGGSGGSYVYKFSLKDESFKLIYSSHSTQGKQLMLKNGQLFGLLNTENFLSPPNRGQFFSIDTLGNGYRILSMVEDKPEFVAPFHHMADESPTSILVTGETQIFRYDMQAWNMSVVTTFPKEVGQKLNAPPIATKNNGILGVALEGGQSFGTVYHLNQNGSDLKVLHRFTDKDGTRRSGLVAGLNGDYYGTNYAGGAKGGGYIYRVNPMTSTVEIMSHFDMDVGIAPSSSLILANNGEPISTLQVLNKGVSITNQLNIGSTVVESNSGSVVIDLINKSEKEKIEIGNARITGPDAAYFQIDQNSLSRSLNAADQTRFTIFFKPNARRTYNATLEIISNATVNPEISIALQAEGIGVSQQITFSMPETVEAAQDYVEFSATSSSGLPVKVESVYPEYARVEGNRIVILKAGKGGFIATQEGNDKYNPAIAITKSLEIKRSKPIFTYEIPGSVPLSRREVEFKLQSSSGQSLEISTSNPSIARIEGNKIILLKTGEFFIIANHKQTDRYVQVSVYISMSITKNIQKLSLDFKSKAQITEGSINVNASSSAGLPVSLKSGDESIARIENNKIILLKPGTVKIEAYQGGNEEYEAASLTYLLTISKASQNISLDFKTPVEITEKEISYTVSASSGLPVVVTSSDESIARIEGSKIAFLKSGSVNINATQLGNETYEAASTVVRLLEIRKLSQTISLDFKTPVEITEKEISYTVSASSGLPVVVTSSDESIARIEGSKIAFLKSGSVNINATQLGNETYEAASTVVRLLEIRKLSQTISLDFKTPVEVMEKEISYTVSASSGLPVVVTSSDESIARIEGNQIKLIKSGTVFILASQTGNDIYEAAPIFTKNLEINKVSQTIEFDSIPTKYIDEVSLELKAKASSGLAVEYISADTSITKIKDNKAIFVKEGKVLITAQQLGNDIYRSISTSRILTIDVVLSAHSPVLGDAWVVYPNPTKGVVMIKEMLGRKTVSIQVLDLLGKVLPFQWIDSNTISLGNLPSGVYMIVVDDGSQQLVRKVVKY